MFTAENVDWATIEGPVLLAGDSHHVPEMQRIARLLPAGASASLFIEAFSRVQVYRVKVPEGVTVTWLLRDRQFVDRSPCAVRSRGQRLGVAVRGWLSEWACDTGGGSAACTVWLAAGTPPHIVRMARAALAAERIVRAPRSAPADSASRNARVAPRRQEH